MIYIYLDQYLCIFGVRRLPKQFGVDVVYVHIPDAGHSDRYLPLNKKTVEIVYIVPLITSNYLHNHFLVMLEKKVNIVNNCIQTKVIVTQSCHAIFSLSLYNAYTAH